MPGRVRNAATAFRDVWRDPRFYGWCLLLVLGFAYVAVVVCDRPNPLASRGGEYADIVKLLVTAPFLFLLGPRHSLSPLCAGRREVLLWNGLGYLLPFFLGLNWAYLQHVSVINYSLTWSDLSRMHPIGMAVFAAGGVAMAALAVYHGVLAHREGILAPYAGTFAGAVLLIAAITWARRGNYYLHVHHYFFFGFFIPWTRFRNPVSIICQAFCAGVYVEGISEWGMDPIWALRH